ncbi:MAG: hypothetical protein ACRDFQ_07870, partial [Anaerolineales bacterium]
MASKQPPLNPNVFIPGTPRAPSPLERYLPPLPSGVVSAWLKANAPRGAWILDPFGASPQLAVEAAGSGYRVAVAANNPIARFLIEVHAQPPTKDALTAALAELGASRRGEERLEPAILDLYMTECPNCHALGPANYFVWERDGAFPVAKELHCKNCGAQGEYPANEQDRERAQAFTRTGPHTSRALERIAPKGDEDRAHAEEALEAYLPRAVYALFSIINRIDGLNLPEGERNVVSALVLAACDRANCLWGHPSGRLRPKQLSVPAQFREYNIWYEMENSIQLWAQETESVPIVAWPGVPPETGGISLFEGRVKDMTAGMGGIRPVAIVTALPRPNQAYWTLCALWAGWLWGRGAIGPFALVLRRKRYDWAWHCEALHAAISAVSENISDSTALFGIITESETGFNTAAHVAINLAGFRMDGSALRREENQLQFTWRKAARNSKAKVGEVGEIIRSVAQSTLIKRGEPTHFPLLQGAALGELARLQNMAGTRGVAGELYNETKENIDIGFTFRSSFLRYAGTEQSLETGLWWLDDTAGARSPLSDRVEIAVVRFLLRWPRRSIDEIDRALCAAFPGFITPPPSLILNVFQSYGEERVGQWFLADADNPKSRRNDLREIRGDLVSLGERFGYSVSRDGAIAWSAKDGNLQAIFYVIASSVLGEILLKSATPPAKSFVVLPGRRAQLALHKIERDPRFNEALENGWRFLKYRHIRRLSENLSLTAESFAEVIDMDPLTLE